LGDEEGKRKRAKANEALAGLGVYRKEKIEVLRGEPDTPNADYAVTISKRFFDLAARAEALKAPQQELDAVRAHFARLENYGFIRIGQVELNENSEDDAGRIHFTVELQATHGLRRLWFHEPSLFFGAVPLRGVQSPLGLQLFFIARLVLYLGSWIAVLLGVVITSFFVPNMLQKGAIDLLLVKPIRRSLLLFFKYVGGLTFIFLANAFAILGVWLVLGLRSGIWANWMLLLIPILTFFFAILYSVSTLFAVLTRSTVTAILVTIGAWLMFFVVGAMNTVFEAFAREEVVQKKPVEERVFADSTIGSIVGAIHRVLPRTSDLDELSMLLVFSDFMTGGYLAPEEILSGERNWWESFGVSTAFIIVMLGLACWRFARKDY
jgi:ABC-type transport system involved in multi-copper enzyme maturation permease subunit